MSAENVLPAIAVIPARYASSRFPGKPLALIHGKTMLQRVYEQVTKATSVHHIIIATDDQRIADHAATFNATVVMTDPHHSSGTDRIAEAMRREEKQYKVVVNVQGDEPFIDPAQINDLVHCFTDEGIAIATLVKRIDNTAEFNDPNVVKAVLTQSGRALYFSRSTIPYHRGGNSEKAIIEHPVYKHIGMYAYRSETLQQITRLQPSSLEITESLEQLRWLQNGYVIQTKETFTETIAVDTLADLHKAEAHLLNQKHT